MSGQLHSHGRRLKGKLAAAAMTVLFGAPAFVQAAKTPPPPPAPLPQALNLDPNVHWFASWDARTNPPPADFIVTPSNYVVGGVGTMQTHLHGAANGHATRPLGSIIEQPLSTTDAANLFNTKYGTAQNRAISYVFSDMEAGTQTQVLTNVTNLVNQVRGSTWSKNAYVGHFGLTPLNQSDDRSFRNPAAQGPNASAHRNFGRSHYDSSKVNMANTILYPGSATYRNRSTNDWQNANIRTGLFLGPIWRMSKVQDELDAYYGGTDTLGIGLAKHKQIPWVTRFNNAGNTSLDTDGNSANLYRFQPGAPLVAAGLSGAQTTNQMVGRGDFSAQIQHYRMRGAYSVNLFSEAGPHGGGVENYTSAQAKEDVRYGWYGGTYGLNVDNAASVAAVAHANTVFGQPDNKQATRTFNPIIDGVSDAGGARAEQTGTLWSGVYSLSMPNPNSVNTIKGQNGKGSLDILASNLDTALAGHKIKFGTVDVFEVFTDRKGGTGSDKNYTWSDNSNALADSRNFLIEAGMHRLLQFDLVTTRVYNSSTYTGSYTTKSIWLLNQSYLVFQTNNRMDVGVPEPTTFGMLAAAGSMAVVCRRNRRNKKAAAAAGF